MTLERGKPVYLTKGERKLVVDACEAAIETWTAIRFDADKERAHMGKLRCLQYRRIIRECIQADPEPKNQ